ncbi:MAG: hypothetical protein B7X10_02010 [Burkholderiales bacterium 21-58-4]|nr:MAG: hypothetical protein B7X10_02010 [Burkholderiales bacterium 21-58-4]
MSFLKVKPLRSEKHRRNVAALPCVVTGRPGPSQCAHVNFGKGMGLKVCDSLCFPLSPEAHREHYADEVPNNEVRGGASAPSSDRRERP